MSSSPFNIGIDTLIVLALNAEILTWLEQERWDDEEQPETISAIVNRKLEKLIKLEQQGY